MEVRPGMYRSWREVFQKMAPVLGFSVIVTMIFLAMLFLIWL